MPAKRKSISKRQTPIKQLLEVMSRLRAPDGCPWDKEQDHKSIRMHAIEEVYELVDAIEADDDVEMEEELGDLLLQVVFHCQLARERGVFDFDKVAQRITDKLIHRHPHVFGDSDVDTVDGVWTQWEDLKRKEKEGTQHERPSVLDGIPRHLPALHRAEKLVKKARKNDLMKKKPESLKLTKSQAAAQLFEIASYAQAKGWSAEALLRGENERREKKLRRKETKLDSTK